jgi:hypothetical protein
VKGEFTSNHPSFGKCFRQAGPFNRATGVLVASGKIKRFWL